MNPTSVCVKSSLFLQTLFFACGIVILLRPDFPGILRETDLIAPGAVQITEQAPVVVDHAIQNVGLCHFTAHRRPSRQHQTGRGSCSSPAWGPSSTCPPPRAHCRLPSSTAAQTLHEGAGESHQQEEKRCITAPLPLCKPSSHSVHCGKRVMQKHRGFSPGLSLSRRIWKESRSSERQKKRRKLHMLIGTRRHHCWG